MRDDCIHFLLYRKGLVQCQILPPQTKEQCAGCEQFVLDDDSQDMTGGYDCGCHKKNVPNRPE